MSDAIFGQRIAAEEVPAGETPAVRVRNARRPVIIGAALVALIVLAVAVMALWPSSSNGIATYTVQPMKFSRRVTADGTLKAVNATPITTPNQANRPLKIAWIEQDGALVKKGQVIVRFDPTEFEDELITGNEERATANNKLTKTSADAKTTKTNLKRDAGQAQSELDAAKRFQFDDAEIFSRYQRIESEVDADLAGDKKQHAEEVLQVRDNLSRADMDLIGIEDRKAGLRIRNAENGLKALEVLSPNDGILVLQRDWRGEIPRVGSTQWPGSPLAEIPQLDKMKAEVFVLEADAAGLAVDQNATLWLESRPQVKYKGKISQLDKLARPRLRGVPVQYFGVTIGLDKTEQAVMKPGSRVRAVLELENLDRAFAIPRQALFEKEGKKLVYRKRGEKFEPVAVTISSSSAGRVVVTKGILQGDQLALSDPTAEKKDEA